MVSAALAEAVALVDSVALADPLAVADSVALAELAVAAALVAVAGADASSSVFPPHAAANNKALKPKAVVIRPYRFVIRMIVRLTF